MHDATIRALRLSLLNLLPLISDYVYVFPVCQRLPVLCYRVFEVLCSHAQLDDVFYFPRHLSSNYSYLTPLLTEVNSYYIKHVNCFILRSVL